MYVEFGTMSTTGIRSLTFGLKKGNDLVPVAKVQEFGQEHDLAEILDFMKRNTIERFGPVRTVTPQLLYQLSFDEISPSPRHKSGVKLKNIRLEGKLDDTPENATSFHELESLV